MGEKEYDNEKEYWKILEHKSRSRYAKVTKVIATKPAHPCPAPSRGGRKRKIGKRSSSCLCGICPGLVLDTL
jgi:hypothetical protein